MARPIAAGLLVAVGTAVAWAVLSAVLGFHLGLLVVAAFGGWLIGSVIRPVGRRAGPIAAALGLLAWAGGSVLDFALSQALIPNPATALTQRLSFAAYLDYASATFDFVQMASIALLVVVGWWSAR